jgi:hypothetical protein
MQPVQATTRTNYNCACPNISTTSQAETRNPNIKQVMNEGKHVKLPHSHSNAQLCVNDTQTSDKHQNKTFTKPDCTIKHFFCFFGWGTAPASKLPLLDLALALLAAMALRRWVPLLLTLAALAVRTADAH